MNMISTAKATAAVEISSVTLWCTMLRQASGVASAR